MPQQKQLNFLHAETNSKAIKAIQKGNRTIMLKVYVYSKLRKYYEVGVRKTWNNYHIIC